MKQRTKSKRARDKRDEHIISQMWKADQVARKISNFTGLPFEELRDAALEYIVRIYDTWDQSKGANFSTWVNRCLQFHMLNYLRDSSRLVKMPRSYSDLYLKIRKYLIKMDYSFNSFSTMYPHFIFNCKNSFSNLPQHMRVTHLTTQSKVQKSIQVGPISDCLTVLNFCLF